VEVMLRSLCTVPDTGVTAASAETTEIGSNVMGDTPHLPRRSREGQVHCWDDVDPTRMLIRGPDYLQDRCKVLSSTAMLRMVHLDLYTTQDMVVHYAASARAGNIVRSMREAGDRRFIFITNWLIPPHQLVIVWAVPDDPEWLTSPEGVLFSRFRGMDDDERNARLKLIPRIVEGPLMIKRALPEIPSIIGRKLPISYFVGEDYLEASINVVSSDIGRRLLHLQLGATRHFSLEVFLLIEGQQQDELPERILGGFSFYRVDMQAVPVR